MKTQKRSWLFGVMAGTVLTFTTQVGMALAEPPDIIHFQLVPNPAFVRCLAQNPDDPDRPPIAEVTVRWGRLNHVGFWFNDPNDAAACSFNVNNPTPFNGEHRAGPLAMISVSDPNTQLGPLCSNPDTSTSPVRCNP